MDIDTAIRIGTVCISSIALIVSITVAWSNRKSLDVVMPDNLEIVNGGTIFFIEDDGNTLPYGNGLVGVIEVVNPSPTDIAFFDLRAFDPKTNINIPLLTRRTMLVQFRDKTLYRAIETSDDVDLVEQLIPETNYGIFKSNSFTRFHIIIFPGTEATEVGLNFKVAMKAKTKDPFALTSRKKFKFYGTIYSIATTTENTKTEQSKEPEEPLLKH